MHRAAPPPPASVAPRAAVRALVAPALVVAAGLLAWWGVWHGQFLFDDEKAIVDNAPLLAGDWWSAAFAHYTPLANRPLACLSLALDFAVFGPGPFGPHLTNLVLHLGNALLLLTLAQRTARRSVAGRGDAPRARWLACAIAVLWVVHPLAADAVAYATQRSTLLASGWLLLALHAVVRADGATHARRWRLVAVLALSAAMASKEDAVVAPLLVVLFERAFLLPSWSAMRGRGQWYAAIAASWVVLAVCVWLGPSNPTVGYATHPPATAWQWLLTQSGVVAHYLRLSLVPYPLRGAYDLDIVRDWREAIGPGLVVLAVLAAVVASWRRHAWWGWLGALFFLGLAPTSTILPIVSEIAAERRVYLPMLFGLVPLVVLVDRLAGPSKQRRRWATALMLAAAAALVLQTRGRVAVYGREAPFWADVQQKRDPASRTFLAGQILTNLGAALWRAGQVDEGTACMDAAVQCEQPSATTFAFHALSLLGRGRHEEAVRTMRAVAQSAPTPVTRSTLGICLAFAHETAGAGADDPRLAEAEAALTAALQARPRDQLAWGAMAYVLRAQGRAAAAVDAYARLNELSPDDVKPTVQRAELLEQLGRAREILPLFDRLLATHPADAALRVYLAGVCTRQRDVARASALLREALRIDPANQQAAAMLRALPP